MINLISQVFLPGFFLNFLDHCEWTSSIFFRHNSYQYNKFHLYFPPIDGPKGLRCKAPQLYRKLWERVRPNRYSWSDPDILPGFWKWEGFPFRIRYHLQGNGSIEIPGDNRRTRPPCVQHQGRSPQARHLKKIKNCQGFRVTKFIKRLLLSKSIRVFL